MCTIKGHDKKVGVRIKKLSKPPVCNKQNGVKKFV